MTVNLREVTRDNFRQIARLKVANDQLEFVANNGYSLAQAKYEPEFKLTPLGVYDDDTPVGFVMYGASEENGREIWAIWRLMIDQNHQRKGYGRAAIEQTIKRIQAETGCDEIYISFVPANVAAKTLYSSLGFEDTGIIEDGEVVYKLTLSKV
jgi:diamine N-acetyltransferase